MWRLPRSVQTTIPCKQCKAPLKAERSCHEVTLVCPQCRVRSDVKEYAHAMDESLEAFICDLFCDRV